MNKDASEVLASKLNKGLDSKIITESGRAADLELSSPKSPQGAFCDKSPS